MSNYVDDLGKLLKRIGLAALATIAVLIGAAYFLGTLTGCVEIPQDDPAPKTSNVTCVVVGMENSQRFGACPGCQRDADSMAELFRTKYGYPVTLLKSALATRINVINAIIDAVRKTPEDGLFILYYSGHGGQELLSNWSTQEPEGADKEDEYLCLYDDYLLDDEIWELLGRCKGRVFCGFDACHSATMYRSVVPDYLLRKGVGVPLREPATVKSSGRFNLKPRAVPLGTDALRLLCWSGCQEKEYSFGGTFGGVLTNQILANWKADRTYRETWNLVAQAVTAEQPTQHPQATQYGSGFDKVFR